MMSEPPTGGDDFVGKHLYTPEVLLTYFALGGLHCGLFLYGLNVARRGQQWVGYLLSALALVTFTLLVLSPEGGSARRFIGSSFGPLSFFLGIGVLKSESGPYRAAVARGATPARWWPPAVGAIVVVLAIELSMALLDMRAP